MLFERQQYLEAEIASLHQSNRALMDLVSQVNKNFLNFQHHLQHQHDNGQNAIVRPNNQPIDPPPDDGEGLGGNGGVDGTEAAEEEEQKEEDNQQGHQGGTEQGTREARRQALSVNALALLRATPAQPSIGAFTPKTWARNLAAWNGSVPLWSQFIGVSQRSWDQKTRLRFNKRLSIHQEIKRWALLHNNGDLEAAAIELDQVLVVRNRDGNRFSFSDHLQERRRSNPEVQNRERQTRAQPRQQQQQQPRRRQSSTQQGQMNRRQQQQHGVEDGYAINFGRRLPTAPTLHQPPPNNPPTRPYYPYAASIQRRLNDANVRRRLFLENHRRMAHLEHEADVLEEENAQQLIIYDRGHGNV